MHLLTESFRLDLKGLIVTVAVAAGGTIATARGQLLPLTLEWLPLLFLAVLVFLVPLDLVRAANQIRYSGWGFFLGFGRSKLLSLLTVCFFYVGHKLVTLLILVVASTLLYPDHWLVVAIATGTAMLYLTTLALYAFAFDAATTTIARWVLLIGPLLLVGRLEGYFIASPTLPTALIARWGGGFVLIACVLMAVSGRAFLRRDLA